MVKHADLLVCDSINIEKYIKTEYKKYNPQTVFIAYGTSLEPSSIPDNGPELLKWYKDKGLEKKKYYLAVGRFVPENSFETMIKEFMKSNSKRDFAIITTADNKFLEQLEAKLHFKKDKRIKFVGTVYNQELLKKIRENAYAYFHGHTVGGTNPSLIEALGSTSINLLVNVSFNREVAGDSALYWNKQNGNLAKLVDMADTMEQDRIKELECKAKKRISDEYTWEKISRKYEKLFLGN